MQWRRPTLQNLAPRSAASSGGGLWHEGDLALPPSFEVPRTNRKDSDQLAGQSGGDGPSERWDDVGFTVIASISRGRPPS